MGSETGFPLWVEEKARIRAIFLSRSALSLFFALFVLRAFALFFSLRARERKSAKARKKRRRPPLKVIRAFRSPKYLPYLLTTENITYGLAQYCKLGIFWKGRDKTISFTPLSLRGEEPFLSCWISYLENAAPCPGHRRHFGNHRQVVDHEGHLIFLNKGKYNTYGYRKTVHTCNTLAINPETTRL